MIFKSKYPPVEVPECNILSFVFPPGRKPSEKPIWIDANDHSNSLSLADMLSWVKRFAAGLDMLGVGQGETIMVFTPNHIFVPVAYLATAGSKRIFTGANPAYTVDEVAYQMKIIRATIVLIHPSLLHQGLAAAKQAQIPISRVFQFSSVECPVRNGVRDWRDITTMVSKTEAQSWQWDTLPRHQSQNTIAAVNFSSGTTGLPKGVCISHYNLVSNAVQNLANKFHNTGCSEADPGSERWLATLPLYHAYAQLWTITIASRLQASVYIMSKFVFEDYLRCIERYNITTLQVVPPILLMLNKRPETANYKLNSLQTILCGAAPLSPAVQTEVSQRLGAVVVQGWGMTETTCAGIMIPGRMVEDTGSVGYLLPNTEALLLDEEENEVTNDGKPGELLLRGPQIMLKYWENEIATKETLTSDGWLRTGDVAVVEDGKFWIVDRKKELIKVNGLQVAPAEVEAILLLHQDIVDAAVTGIRFQDDEWPRAYVVRREHSQTTEAEVREFVATKVAKHKRLFGGVMFVPEIPKLASGKIIRKQLREWSKRDAKEMGGIMRSSL
ncbi:hypothetical protein B0A52_07108 [Exophiala mesophila]|uniref:AMP-dependent synthetase/ligase domain-containing protein n=1 Tax=Exophiala mesophila TaxID=212818 RepID=A0A438MY48_EXOME|nr:hypothetical protein B0A52_07108 [Exophiala mesophila]